VAAGSSGLLQERPAARSLPLLPARVVPQRRPTMPRLRPGWPLTGLFVGYPLWWVLGVAQLLIPVAGLIMAVELRRRRRLDVERGFGWWLLFLSWVAVGVFLLQVRAPGALPTTSDARYLTFGFRVCLYLSATVALLYVYNERDRLSTSRLFGSLAWFFVTVVAGGVLGTLAPHLDFPSALELVLPHRLTHVSFVHNLVHPVVAQLHTVNGVENPRASAPFAYTNDWGRSVACLLPFFLVAWSGPAAGWRRRAAPVVLLVAVYPVVMSQNRGLWLALVIAGVLVCVRALLFGSVRFVLGMLLACIATVGVLLSTPLGGTVDKRLTNAGSENGRGSLGAQTLDSVTNKAPVVGLGTTRAVQGSFYSIAGGDTSSCVGCTPPPLGTQGHFWLVVYSTGYGGLALYLGFVLQQFLRHWRLRTKVATAGLVVVVAHLATMLVYDTIGIGLLTIFVAIGVLWREARADDDRRSRHPRPDPTLAGYRVLLRRNRGLVAAGLVLGLGGGLLYQAVRGIETDATTAVVVPLDAVGSGSAPNQLPQNPQTMDTIAQLIAGATVRRAAGAAAGTPISPDDARLFVTARANTRVLEIHFSAAEPQVATRVTRAAATALLAERARLLRADRTAVITALETQRTGLVHALDTLDATRRATGTLGTGLARQRENLVTRVETGDAQIAEVRAAPVAAGSVLATAAPTAESDSWLVSACSGALLGFATAVVLAFGRHARRRSAGFGPPPTLRQRAQTGPDDIPWPADDRVLESRR
jgi:hypothetical protein